MAQDEGKAEPPKKEAIQRKLIEVINSQAGSVDACTGRYVSEYPKANGTASIELKVNKEGAVARATITTSLAGARNLRLCLEKVAKAYRFPPPESDELVTLSFQVLVKPGAKFKMYMPGEEPKAEQAEQRPPSFFKLLPTGWSAPKE